MKKLFNLPKIKFILLVFVLWRLILQSLSIIAPYFFYKNEMYVWPNVWANFDGVHYITIAKHGYQPFQQAFFPVYPLLMHFLAKWFMFESYVNAGLLISNVSFILFLFVLWKILEKVKIGKKKITDETIRWTILFIAFFPTSFYFGSVYTESLFILLVSVSFYLLIEKKFFWYGLTAGIASGVRLVGSFLLVPIGLLFYMIYLGKTYNDALLFIHSQSAFGAGRSGSDLIFLPQVYFRYINMFARVVTGQDQISYTIGIAFLEILFFHMALFLLWKAWKQGLPRVWIYFSIASIALPTLSGTFLSMPRFVLVAFPVYIVLASYQGRIRLILFMISVLLLSVLTMLFTQGNWVS